MKPYEIHGETRQSQLTAVARTTLTAEEIGPWLSRVYAAVADALATRNAGPAGPPFARFHVLGAGRFVVEAGFPATTTIEAVGDVLPSALPGGQVAVTVHTGPYDEMEPAYEAVSCWVNEHGGKLEGDAWEVFFSDPSAEPDPATWRTEIVQPYVPA